LANRRAQGEFSYGYIHRQSIEWAWAGRFFASLTSSPPVAVTRGEATASTLRYDFSDGRYVIVTGAGFDYALGEPTAGSITGVQLFGDTNIELAAFTDVNDRDLVDFDELWMDDDDSHGVFNHLLPGSDSLIGGEGNDTLTPGLGSDIVDGGLGGTDEVAYRGGSRGNTGVTVDLDHGNPDDDIGAAWSGIGAGASALEFDTLISIENVFGSTSTTS
jgi:RTX calcium-binding nonapeptide repeat (4 copies)